MKKYTLIKNSSEEIMLVRTNMIYEVVNLDYSCDKTCIFNKKREELTPTEGYYHKDYFVNNEEEILVVKVRDIKDDPELMSSFSSESHLTINDGWDEIEVIDVTEYYMSYIYGKAIDIEHGINTDTIIIDGEDDPDGWKSEEEVNVVDWYCEYEQNYPTQEYTRILVLDDGRKVRETTPFLEDKDMCSYEFVD